MEFAVSVLLQRLADFISIEPTNQVVPQTLAVASQLAPPTINHFR